MKDDLPRRPKTFRDYWPRFLSVEVVTVALNAFVMLCQFLVLGGLRTQAAEMAVLKWQVGCLATVEPSERQTCTR